MKSTTRHSLLYSSILVLILGLSLQAHAQSYNVLHNKNYEIEARMHYGYLYFQSDTYHSALSRYSTHAPSYEVSLHRATFGKNRWEVLYNYPSIGLTFYYSQLGNTTPTDELGDVFALYPFINFPLNRNPNSKLTFKLGVGLSYLTNKFDPVENWHNYAIGSHFNAAVNLSFEYRQRITDRLHWATSFGLTHFSNGATMSPNMGINIFSTATGFSWFLRKPNPLLDKKLRPKLYLFEFDGKRFFVTDLQYTFGYKDLSQEYGTHNFFFVHDIAANIMLQLTLRDRLGIGIEFVNDNSYKALHPEWLNEIGFLLSYEMLLDRVSFMFNLGIRNNEKMPAKAFLFYQKLAARCYFTDNLFAILAFTTFDIKADFISFGFGYLLTHKYYPHNHEKKNSRSPIFPH